MLYFEDHFKTIEHLPQELRDKFAEIGEKDLRVQNKLDKLEKRQKDLFNLCKQCTGELPASLLAEYESI